MPQRLKDRLENAVGAFTYGGRNKNNALLNPEDRDRAPAMHRIVRTHPETGRKSLYFDPGKIIAIEGSDKVESDSIIDELTALMVEPDGEIATTGTSATW